MSGGFGHPEVDQVCESYVITESRESVIMLTPGRVHLLARAAEVGTRVVLITDEWSALTPALATTWRDAGAAWVVRGANGLREGFSGRRLTDIGAVFTTGRVREPADVDPAFLHPSAANAVEVHATVSLRHRPRATTLLGGPAETLATFADRLRDRPQLSWGPHEPTGLAWHRGDLTTLARTQMPSESYVVVAGEGYRASIIAQRTTEGVEEITQAAVNMGTPSTTAFERTRQEFRDSLTRLTEMSMQLIAMISARPGDADLLSRPVLRLPPTPLLLLIGPPAVRGLELPVQQLIDEHGAVRVGRPRIPGLLFDLGSFGEPTWERLDALLAAIGPERLASVPGLGNLTPTTTNETTANEKGDDHAGNP